MIKLKTSGTTGAPKEVLYTDDMILACAENLVEAQGYHKNLIFITTGPLDHLGSLSKVWATELVGGTLRSLPGMKDLNAFFDAFEIHNQQSGINQRYATFLVPAALRMLMRFAPERLAALNDRLDFIETGAAPMAQVDMDHLCQLLPDVRLYNTYASTETGIQCTHDFNHQGCYAGCLGLPMKHSHVEILADGRIRCTGACVVNGDFTTNDLGHLDDAGRLWLTGRSDDMLNIGGFKISPIEIEEVALCYPGISECLCRAVAHPVLGESLQLIYATDKSDAPTPRQIAQFLKSRLPQEKLPTSYQLVDKIPRTSNGKPIRR